MKLKTLTTSGIAITRRDYCLMVKNCYREVINGIMDNSIEFAIDILNDKQELVAHLINEDCGLHFSKVMNQQRLKLNIE